MINKREFFKKVRKNRFWVTVISVIVIMGVYYGVEDAIDKYVFKSNSDIIELEEEIDYREVVVDDEAEGVEEKNWFEKLFSTAEDSKDEIDVGEVMEADGKGESVEEGRGVSSTSGKIPEDEVDFELEAEINNSNNLVDTDVLMKGDNAESSIEEKIYVYITGEVNVPGVVILNKGSRITDAINAAGGTTIKANVSKVNLVYVLEDGMKVNIPNNNDLKNNPDFEYITMSSGDGADDVNTRGDFGDDTSTSNFNSGRNYSIVNINTATQTELETLPGIGPSLALKIINYRKENGNFSSIEGIKNVSGIGDSKYENIKKYIKI